MIFTRVAVAALSRRVVGGGPVSRLAVSRRQPLPLWMSTVTVPPPPTSHHPHTPLQGAQGSIIYTETDEAPALATYSLYPAVAKVRLEAAQTKKQNISFPFLLSYIHAFFFRSSFLF